MNLFMSNEQKFQQNRLSVKRSIRGLKKFINQTEILRKKAYNDAKKAFSEGRKNLYATYKSNYTNCESWIGRAANMNARLEQLLTCLVFVKENKSFAEQIKMIFSDLKRITKITSNTKEPNYALMTELMDALNDKVSNIVDGVSDFFEINSDEESISGDEFDKMIESEVVTEMSSDKQLDELRSMLSDKSNNFSKESHRQIDERSVCVNGESQIQHKQTVFENDRLKTYKKNNFQSNDFSLNNIVESEENDSIRPLSFKDFIGQEDVVKQLQTNISAAKIKGEPLGHVLLKGSRGLGKTTLAKIIANEMGSKFIEINSSQIKPYEMIDILTQLNNNDIIFIDEIHKLPKTTIESVLYSAMEDGKVNRTVKEVDRYLTETVKISPFTLIAATTESGELLKPFIDRCKLQFYMQPYSIEVLSQIVINAFKKLGAQITEEDAINIAKRSRGIPRIANNFVNAIFDRELVAFVKKNPQVSLLKRQDRQNQNISISPECINEHFNDAGIDELGLRLEDRNLLIKMIENFNGGPIGLENMAKILNESVNVINQDFEWYLLKIGFLRCLPTGRVVTDSAREFLGYPRLESQIEPNDKG